MTRHALRAAAAAALLAALIRPGAAAANVAEAGSGFMLIEHQRRPPAPPPAATDPGSGGGGGGAARLSPGGAAARRFAALIGQAERLHRLPDGLLDALIAVESGHGWWRVSPAGAAGLTQLMPATAVELGVTDRFDPAQSIDGGARYLRRMLDRFGSVALALAAYNAGPGAVGRAGTIPLNGETPRYVERVLRAWRSGSRTPSARD